MSVHSTQNAVSQGSAHAGQHSGSVASKPVDPQWAWAAYEPDQARPWDLARVGHLYRRAAFGASWQQLQQALEQGPQAAIDRLLRPEEDLAAFNLRHDEYEAATARAGNANELRSWWLRRMLNTPYPLLEKMTLFWHGHFAISNHRVQNAGLMLAHMQLLRKHALGAFGPLLQEVVRDPAVLAGLDADANRQSQPNSNLAESLLGYFALGPKRYSERDVAEAARAFTGWFVLRGRIRYFEREHDTGVKTILGRRGNWSAEDVVRIVLEQPAVAQLLVRKLYGWLVCETDEPSEALLAPLVDSLGQDLNVGRLVERILRSNWFFAPAVYRQRVKSPVEYALGVARGLDGMVGTSRLGTDLASLGQNLLHPPTVKGWHGGRYWLNEATLLERSHLAGALLAGSGPYEKGLDPWAVAQTNGQATPKAAASFLIDIFLQGDVDAQVRQAILREATSARPGNTSAALRRVAHLVATLPEFQLA